MLDLDRPRPPRLVLAIGNPSRGDDALGPALVARLEDRVGEDVELLTDFQLQVEHGLDLAGRTEVIFVDAAESGPEPFVFLDLYPAAEASFSSHALSPAALLDSARRLFGAVPPARLLAIRGHAFELGAPLSVQADKNLAAATAFLLAYLG